VPAPVVITDPADPRVADFRDLKAGDRPEGTPRWGGPVIVEGVPAVERLLASDYRIRAVFGVPGRVADLDALLAGPDPAAPRRLAVLEALNDAENLGSIARSALALGIDGLLLDPRCADPFYRRSVRVSMGHILALPFAVLSHWPGDLDRVHDAGYTTVALTPAADAVDLTSIDPVAHPRTAVLLGAEGPGLTPEAQAAALLRARIPMRPGVDSLGVAAAAAIAFATLR
jgi:tRNA G18 (ribose-2'-O)-methylase SpoU